ncbi:MAG: hypothetical protein HYZ34_12480 [Ignavibacteriae bacterium]|nr:hypothetical protein [Ignavibacteriota bacterium]
MTVRISDGNSQKNGICYRHSKISFKACHHAQGTRFFTPPKAGIRYDSKRSITTNQTTWQTLKNSTNASSAKAHS